MSIFYSGINAFATSNLSNINVSKAIITDVSFTTIANGSMTITNSLINTTNASFANTSIDILNFGTILSENTNITGQLIRTSNASLTNTSINTLNATTVYNTTLNFGTMQNASTVITGQLINASNASLTNTSITTAFINTLTNTTATIGTLTNTTLNFGTMQNASTIITGQLINASNASLRNVSIMNSFINTLTNTTLNFSTMQNASTIITGKLINASNIESTNISVLSLIVRTTIGTNASFTNVSAENINTSSINTSTLYYKSLTPYVNMSSILAETAIAADELLGYSCALNAAGNILAVGSYQFTSNGITNRGKLQIFQYTNSSWQNMSSIFGESATEKLGYSCALNSAGNILAVGSPDFDSNGITNRGKLQIFQYQNASWQNMITILGSRNEKLGFSCALNAAGNILAVGSSDFINGTIVNAGKLQIFQYQNASWQNTQTILGGTEERLGSSCALNADGNILAVGSSDFTNTYVRMGKLQVFQYTNSSWQNTKTIVGENSDENLGSSCALNGAGNILAVGSPNFTNTFDNMGKLQIFQYNSTWQNMLTITGVGSFEYFGYSCAFNRSGNILAIGSYGFDSNKGKFELFQYQNSTWQNISTILGNANNKLGYSCALNAGGNIIAVGAPYGGKLQVFQSQRANLNIDADPLQTISIGQTAYSTTIGYPGSQLLLNTNVTANSINNATITFDTLNSNAGVFNGSFGTGDGNTAFGTYALYSNTSGNNNTAVGAFALDVNASGNNNTALGMYALTNASGSNNTAVGTYADQYSQNTNASNNTAIGYQAYITTNNTSLNPVVNSTALGANSTTNGFSRSTAIGYNASSTAENQIILGTSAEAVFIPGILNTSNVSITNTSIQTLNAITITNTTLNFGTMQNASTVITGQLMNASNVSFTNVSITNMNVINFSMPSTAYMNVSNAIFTNATIGTLNSSSIYYSKTSIPYRNLSTILGPTMESLGTSCALNAAGNILAVGSRSYQNGTTTDAGKLQIFQNQNGTWTNMSTILGTTSENLGNSCALNAEGNVLAVGSYAFKNGTTTNAGKLQIFQNQNGTWTNMSTILGPTSELLGRSCALNAAGNVLAVGSYDFKNGTATSVGKLQIFQNQNGTWTNMTTIVGSSSAEYLGNSCALNAAGNILAVGSTGYQHGTTTNAGKIQIYQNQNGTWTLITTILGEPDTTAEYLGWSCALNAAGNVLAVGSPRFKNDTTYSAGKITIYKQDRIYAFIWSQTTSIGGPPNTTGERLGTSCALNAEGNILAVGSPNFTNGTTTDAGKLQIFQNQNGTWTNMSTILGTTKEKLGDSCALNAEGNIIAVGSTDFKNGILPNSVGKLQIFQTTQDNLNIDINTGSFQNIRIGEKAYSTTIGYNGGKLIVNSNISCSDASFSVMSFVTIANGSTIITNAGINTSNASFTNVSATNVSATNINTTNIFYTPPSPYINIYSNNAAGSSSAFNADGTIFATGLTGSDSGKGNLQILQYTNSGWINMSTINGTRTNEKLGSACSINSVGNIIAVSSPNFSSSQGKVQIFQYNTIWINVSTMYGPTGLIEEYGSSTALNAEGNILVVGSVGYGRENGKIEMYEYKNLNWINTTSFLGIIDSAKLGISCALNAAGNILVGGSLKLVKIYEYQNSTWINTNNIIDTVTHFGFSCALNSAGNILAIGAPSFNSNKGKIDIYEYKNFKWKNMSSIESDSNDSFFGGRCAINAQGNIIAGGSIDINPSANPTANAFKLIQYKNLKWTRMITLNGAVFGYSCALNAAGNIFSIGTNNTVNVFKFEGLINIDTGPLQTITIGQTAFSTIIGYPGSQLLLNTNVSVNSINNATITFDTVNNNAGVFNGEFGRGQGNTGLGTYALYSNTSGNNNTAVGAFALDVNVSGSNNTALGMSALTNASGSNNTAIGAFADQYSQNTNASNNTAIGYQAYITTFNTSSNPVVNSTAIGANSRTNGFSNSTAIGYNASSTAENQIILGTSAEAVFIPGLLNTSNVSFVNLSTRNINASNVSIINASMNLLNVTTINVTTINGLPYGTVSTNMSFTNLSVTGNFSMPTTALMTVWNASFTNASFTNASFTNAAIETLKVTLINGEPYGGGGTTIINVGGSNTQNISNVSNVNISNSSINVINISGNSIISQSPSNVMNGIFISCGSTMTYPADASFNSISVTNVNGLPYGTVSTNMNFTNLSVTGNFSMPSNAAMNVSNANFNTINATNINASSIVSQGTINAFSFNSTSDLRMKDIIRTITLDEATKLINNNTAVIFKWKENNSNSSNLLNSGYIAQELINSGFSHLVSELNNPNLKEPDGPNGKQYILNYDGIIPYHGVAIKHLLQENIQMKKETIELKEEVNQLKEEMIQMKKETIELRQLIKEI